MILLTLLLVTQNAAKAASCPTRAERRWSVDMGKVFTTLLNLNDKYTPRSLCLPVFYPAECTPLKTGQLCTTEIVDRTGYQGERLFLRSQTEFDNFITVCL